MEEQRIAGTVGYIDGKPYWRICNNNIVLLEVLGEKMNETFDKKTGFWKARAVFLNKQLDKLIKVEDVYITKAWE